MSHYKPYPAYKDSGVEWLGRVPEHWDVTRISNHYRLRNGFPFDSAGFSPDGEEADRLIRIRDLSPSETWIYTSEPCPKSARVENGDVLVGMDGDFNAVLWQAGPAKLNQRVCALRGETEFLTKFLLYSLPFPLRIINDTAYSTTVKHLSSGEVLGTRIALPPPCELRSIVSHLDRETARIDALVAKKTRFIELLREKRQALITHAVTKGLDPNVRMKDSGVEWLGEVPEHWEVRSVSSVSTKITNGYVGPTRDILVEDGVRYLQSLHIKGNQIRFDVPYFVTSEWSNQHQKSILETGDVLIVQTGDIGQVTVVTDEFAGCNCHALIIVSPLRSIVAGEWISWAFNSSYGYHTLLSIQTGAMHPHLNCGNVKDVALPVPPLDEQRAIIQYIEHEERRVSALIAKTESSIDLLKERRAALIAAAVTGQIDLREAV